MEILTGLQNFLIFINDNWTAILVCIGLIIGLIQKIKSYVNLSIEEKIEIAKKQISERILKLISDAEENYQAWVSAGEIKRSEVIAKIYDDYPVLSKVVDQDALVKWIDEQIDNALPTLRELWEQKTEKEAKEAENKKDEPVIALKVVSAEQSDSEDIVSI